jgi:gluconolactonase
MRIIAQDLKFPEGPICLPDGSLLAVEVRGQNLTRIGTDGRLEVVAHLGGGPNGAALGPDGKCYVCNNGGFEWASHDGVVRPSGVPDAYQGGWIERVDLSSGQVERVYEAVGGERLLGPNDIVFDAHGGMWFTDMGKRRARSVDLGGVCYAKADGSLIEEVIRPLITPNGISLSPDGKTLYVAETDAARIWAWDLAAPGKLARAPFPSPNGGRMLYASPFFTKFDSMGVEANGNLCVASFMKAGITVISPQGELVEFVPIEQDWFVTNICFGGPDMRSAYVTLSGAGQLIELPWARPGLALNYALNRALNR